METIELRGKPVVDHLRDNIKKRVESLNSNDIIPRFLLIRLGNKENDLSYEKAIIKNCEAVGVNLVKKELPEDITQKDLVKEIEEANSDSTVHGIMIFRPLPKHIDEKEIGLTINPEKDVDAMSPINLGKLIENTDDGFVPCTPKGVIEMLEYNDFDFEGANVVILGRSLVVGKPLSMMFLEKNSTPTVCHSKTKNLKEITKNADLVVSALGRAKMLDESYFKEDTTVIDVGVNVDENGKLCGDVDYENVFGKVEKLTPVPGGVGSITTTVLMDQIVKACENQTSK